MTIDHLIKASTILNTTMTVHRVPVYALGMNLLNFKTECHKQSISSSCITPFYQSPSEAVLFHLSCPLQWTV